LSRTRGSVRKVAQTNGTILDALTFDSYGDILTEPNPANGDRFKFTGREWDSEIGLQFNRARYYDPKTGRWISEDPIGFNSGDSNFYRYVGNELLVEVDPDGHGDENQTLYHFPTAEDNELRIIRPPVKKSFIPSPYAAYEDTLGNPVPDWIPARLFLIGVENGTYVYRGAVLKAITRKEAEQGYGTWLGNELKKAQYELWLYGTPDYEKNLEELVQKAKELAPGAAGEGDHGHGDHFHREREEELGYAAWEAFKLQVRDPELLGWLGGGPGPRPPRGGPGRRPPYLPPPRR
jgi:RHS repeat-associated protein